ncbi:MAG: hypothetical protein WCI62_01755 [Erysipelotrichaceae bacterium]
MMAIGVTKSSVVKQMVNAKIISTEFPASIVLLRDYVTLVVDNQAASEIDNQ